MEFIEAKIDPNSTLKNALKKVEERSPQKMKQKRNKKAEKRDRAQGWGTAQPC